MGVQKLEKLRYQQQQQQQQQQATTKTKTTSPKTTTGKRIPTLNKLIPTIVIILILHLLNVIRYIN